MSTLPEGITQAEIDRYAKLDAGVKKLTAEKKELGEKIKFVLTAKSATYTFEDVVVSVAVRKGEFDKELATDTFPADRYPDLYTLTIDPEKVRKSLGKAADDLNKAPTLALSVKTVTEA